MFVWVHCFQVMRTPFPHLTLPGRYRKWDKATSWSRSTGAARRKRFHTTGRVEKRPLLSTAFGKKPTPLCPVGGSMNWCNMFAEQSSNLRQNLIGMRLSGSDPRAVALLECVCRHKRHVCITAALSGLFIIADPETAPSCQQDICAYCGTATQWFLLGCQRNHPDLCLSLGHVLWRGEKKHLCRVRLYFK